MNFTDGNQGRDLQLCTHTTHTHTRKFLDTIPVKAYLTERLSMCLGYQQIIAFKCNWRKRFRILNENKPLKE